MKINHNIRSFWILIILSVFTIGTRYYYSEFKDKGKVINWDGLGYYYYLPGVIIHHDLKDLAWLKEANKEYDLTGEDLYQYRELENGNKVGKYFCGVSIMQLPFFLIGHGYAELFGYKTDGFSKPYQNAIAFGIVFYFILALFLLRRVLLRYYDDLVVSISLIVLVLGTNLLEYVAIENALSHSYIFLLYVLILNFTIKWHESPSKLYASLIGAVIGFAVLCRPTEAVMLFIPLFWNTQSKELRKEKWQTLKRYRVHLIYSMIAGAVLFLPQIIYWKYITGSFIYDVGSKWVFLNPWFRVLFGFEKGWFIYTPLTILFIAGFFFMKGKPFQRSVIIFGLLNIWIIISWHEWHYGGTYSTRALVQSYPVLCLALCAILSQILKWKRKYLLIIPGLYFVSLNLFQIWQYNEGIIHNRDMNFKYYSAIYWDSSPSDLDMSLLDTDEIIENVEGYEEKKVVNISNTKAIASQDSSFVIFKDETLPHWFHIEAKITSNSGFSNSHLYASNKYKNTNKLREFRLDNAMKSKERSNTYEFYFKVEAPNEISEIELGISTRSYFEGKIDQVLITELIPSKN